jgi:MFS transporter, DHA2 family, multidrug resistance protein
VLLCDYDILLSSTFDLLDVTLLTSSSLIAHVHYIPFTGYCTDKFGRRPTIILYAFIFTVAAIIMGITPEIITLYVGRFIGGIGVGGLSMAGMCCTSVISQPFLLLSSAYGLLLRRC